MHTTPFLFEIDCNCDEVSVVAVYSSDTSFYFIANPNDDSFQFGLRCCSFAEILIS
jgi:hypothetical protein